MPTKDKVKLAAKRKRNRKRNALKGRRGLLIANCPDHLRDKVRAMAKRMISDSKGGRDE